MSLNTDSTDSRQEYRDTTLAELETAEILQNLRDTVAERAHTPPFPAQGLETGSEEIHVEEPRKRVKLGTETETGQEREPRQPSLGAYWDASTMAPLNAASAAAIARLRAYKAPYFPSWDALPLSRRAAVLMLLFADHRGDLRVVITMRAASLRSFSGHAALPGGKADSLQETPYQIARREAWEEIGLPQDDAKVPKPFRIEYLCQLPCSLAKTELAVRPNVAFLHADDEPGKPSSLVAESLIPRLDAKEVAAVFSGSLHNFLRAKDELQEGEKADDLPDGEWYDGEWSNWHESPWRIHYFHVPVHNQKVTKPKRRDGGQAAIAEEVEEEEDTVGRFLVWGLTGRMLVDTARIAFAEEPDFEHNSHYGDEAIIERLEKDGRLPEKKRREIGVEVTKENLKESNL